LFLAGIGIAAGYYFAGPGSLPPGAAGSKDQARSTVSAESALSAGLNSVAALPAEAAAEPANRSRAATLHRFPLTAADVKDTQGAPDIAVDGDGGVHLIWASITGETEQTVFVANSQKGLASFSNPQAIVRSAIAFRSQGAGKKGYAIRMAPHVVAQGDAIHLSWSEAVPDGTTVRMVLVNSTDRGTTYSSPRGVHGHPQARPTFTALAMGAQGELACCWLDGRAAAQQPFASLRPAGQNEFLQEMKLPGGENDKGVCPCCPTCATFAPDGTLFIAFRNLVHGYRDPAVVRLRPGEQQFAGPFAVVPPTWKFDGCPHDGPSLVVANGQLHVTWMDAHTGAQRVYYGRAALDDLQFQFQPLHADGPGTQSNAKLYADARGVHVVWEESLAHEPVVAVGSGHQHGPPVTGAGRGIRYAFAPAGADAFQSVQLVHPIAGAYQSRPAIAGDGQHRIFAAWCELNQEGKSIVVTTVAGDDDPRVSQRASR
jgi:hypothetical protein